jgi:hypothetical protein
MEIPTVIGKRFVSFFEMALPWPVRYPVLLAR